MFRRPISTPATKTGWFQFSPADGSVMGPASRTRVIRLSKRFQSRSRRFTESSFWSDFGTARPSCPASQDIRDQVHGRRHVECEDLILFAACAQMDSVVGRGREKLSRHGRRAGSPWKFTKVRHLMQGDGLLQVVALLRRHQLDGTAERTPAWVIAILPANRSDSSTSTSPPGRWCARQRGLRGQAGPDGLWSLAGVAYPK